MHQNTAPPTYLTEEAPPFAVSERVGLRLMLSIMVQMSLQDKKEDDHDDLMDIVTYMLEAHRDLYGAAASDEMGVA
jgi:hypothetical protein